MSEAGAGWKEWRRPLKIVLGVALVTLTAGISRPVSAQTSHGPDAPRGASFALHGHWVLEVRDPDGAVVSRREFDNAPTVDARGHIARLLNRELAPSMWVIEVGNVTGSGPCHDMVFGAVRSDKCYIVDQSVAGSPFIGPAAFATLTTQVGGPGNAQLILAGHFTVRTAGHIERVGTSQPGCSATISPSTCRTIGGGTLMTSHELRNAQGQSAPVTVTPGQIVQVSVTLSFCSLGGCQS